jgi:O-antigen/teichoic acid export membrane protein
LIGKLRLSVERAYAHGGFKRYFKNTSWLFGGQMLRMGLGLFVSVAVARYLGPKDFGLYNYVFSIVTLVAVFGNLGLQNLAKRELVDKPERRDGILGTCFVLSLVAGLIAYALMLLVVGLLTESSLLIGLFALLGGGTLLLNPLKSIEIWFQSQVRSDLSVTASSLALLIFAAVKVAAIYSGAGLLQFAYIFLFEGISLSALLIYFYAKHFGSVLKWKFQGSTAAEFLKQSWPLIISGLAITVYIKVDQIMLGTMLGEQEVGYYSAAARISSVLYLIPAILATSLFPAILNARKQNQALYHKRLQAYFNFNTGLAYAICLPISFAATWIVGILFGGDYAVAAPILAIHSWSSLFVFLGVARGQYLVAEKMFKFSMFCTIFGAVVNVLLNYFLIPLYGGVGAAVATICSHVISAFVSSFVWKRTLRIGRMQLSSIVPVFQVHSLIQWIKRPRN